MNDRMNHTDDQYTCHSPHKGKYQANISTDIQWLICIIPPFMMKNLIHQISGNPFQNCHQHCGQHIQQNQIVLIRCQKIDDYRHANSINRTDRAIQETSVHELSLLCCRIVSLCWSPNASMQAKMWTAMVNRLEICIKSPFYVYEIQYTSH